VKLYTIDFDMDHVLTDFQKKYDEMYLDKQQFPQADAFFFHDLNPLSSLSSFSGNIVDNITFVLSLIEQGHTIRIVTAPSLPNLNCWTGKAYWIKKYFGSEQLDKLIITSDKSPMSISGDLLVDDGIANGQNAYGDRHLLYGSNEYPTMRDVYDQIIKWSEEGKEFPIEQKLEDYKRYLEKC
jgi:5'(3')-deoxyribonucleotidase